MSQDHVESLFVSLNSTFETVKIGAIANVGLVYLDQEVVIFKVAEPVYPPDFDLLTEFAIVWHVLISRTFYIIFKFYKQKIILIILIFLSIQIFDFDYNMTLSTFKLSKLICSLEASHFLEFDYFLCDFYKGPLHFHWIVSILSLHHIYLWVWILT